MRKSVAILSILILVSCSGNIDVARHTGTPPRIEPDYSDVTVPANIAPLHFTLAGNEGYTDQRAIFSASGLSCSVCLKHGQIAVPARSWEKLKTAAAGSSIEVTLQARKDGEWIEFLPFRIEVSEDRIDPYIAYRLIEPGYETWNEMGIYQRCLENFDEEAVVTNNQTDFGCLNCHSFCDYDHERLLFHARAACAGTYMLKDGGIEKLNTKTPDTISALVYPQWHPGGRYVAFSVNTTRQMFHTVDPNRVEVFDLESDVVVYDVERREIVSCPQLKSDASFETFPTFSPDGLELYFCSADSLAMPENFQQVRYSLCRIGFNPQTRSFSDRVDTLYNSALEGRSVSFPRVSPDGRSLMFTLSDYGNFSIWHKDADLYVMDTDTGEFRIADALCSPSVESYHSWSRNGRWVVFSSRRLDNLYTRLFISHVDASGNFSKPFLLPQKKVDFYGSFMKSYNIPEFIDGRVVIDAREFRRTARRDAGISVTYSELDNT